MIHLISHHRWTPKHRARRNVLTDVEIAGGMFGIILLQVGLLLAFAGILH